MVKINRAADYAESQIRSAGKLKSIQMLHEGGVRFAREALEDPSNRIDRIVKVQNIVAQLQMSLRLGRGDLPELMLYLYDYIYNLLEEGDDESLEGVISLLRHLSGTFRMVRQRAPLTT